MSKFIYEFPLSLLAAAVCLTFSETSISGLFSTNQPRLNFSMRILQLIGTEQKWSDYSLVCNVVAGACLQYVKGRVTVCKTFLLHTKVLHA